MSPPSSATPLVSCQGGHLLQQVGIAIPRAKPSSRTPEMRGMHRLRFKLRLHPNQSILTADNNIATSTEYNFKLRPAGDLA